MSLDYRVSLSDIEGDEVDEEILHVPNYDVTDEAYYLQTYLNYINIGDVWKNTLGTTTNGKKLTVAVIDTGIDTDHPEFFDADGNSIISSRSYNASSDQVVEMYDVSVIEDTQGHGTAVSGVIAAQMNGFGTVGIAPEIELIVIKCDTIENSGEFKSASDIIFGIYYAIECDVDVINMSWGVGVEGFFAFASPLQLAVDSDIISIASAGNDSTDQPQYPAADGNTIGVGALRADSWEIADYSNFGINSDITVPGTTYTASLGGGYTYKQGTSFAAPIVTAAVALYISQNEYVRYNELKADLLAACNDLGDLGEDELYGFGCLDVSAFILEEKGTITYDYCVKDLENTEQVFVRSHTIQTVPEPERDNMVFDDWYYDKAYTRVFDYDAWYTTEFVEDVTLYAKWVNEDDEGVSVYNYRTLSDGTIEIVKYNGKRRYLTIPDTINGQIVSSIGAGAFNYNSRLREVILPTGLVYIKDEAFSNVSNLRKVTFTGNQLIEIGSKSFEKCKTLTKISLPDSLKIIGEGAFAECSTLSEIEITQNSNLLNVGKLAFSKTNISTIYIPQYANFDGSMVAYCEQMRSVTFHNENKNYTVENSTVYNADKTILLYHPAVLSGEYTVANGIVEIADYAFASSNVIGMQIAETVTKIGNASYQYTKFTSLEMPNSVTQIGKGVFSSSNLRSITLSENLFSIPLGAFSASKIENINIPQNVYSIGESAFEKCDNLQTITLNSASKLASIDANAFASCSSLKEIIIPSGVSTIGESAFSGCTALRIVEFSFGGKLSSISKGCFSKCTSLNKVVFSDNIKSIDSRAFEDCTKISVLEFSEGSLLNSIGDYAFYSCKSLKETNLPESVTSIGEFAYAFSGLEKLQIGRNISNIGNGAFGACYKLDEISVAEGNSNFNAVDNVLFDYGITTVYCVPATRSGEYTLPESVKIIYPYSFYYCKEIDNVILSATLEEIGASAFYYCTKLEDIYIPASVINIGREAFYYCLQLNEVNFGENSALERLGAYTFYNCGFSSFTVPQSVTSMAQYVFYRCSNLSEITFEKNSKLTYISAYMFSGCNSLKIIVFEEGSELRSIQARGFSGLNSLEFINFGNAKIENIDNYAFYNNTNLSPFAIPESIIYNLYRKIRVLWLYAF